MENNRIEKVSRAAAKMIISEMLDLNFYQIHYDYLSYLEASFVDRERRAFKEDKEFIQALERELITKIATRLSFSPTLTVGKTQMYCTLLNDSFGLTGKKMEEWKRKKELDVFNLLAKHTFFKINAGKRLVELIINNQTVKSVTVQLTPAPKRKRIAPVAYNKTLSLFAS